MWRYSKLNTIPYTEYLESEIEYILVRGRHAHDTTQCYPCRLGKASYFKDKSELCPKNQYFYVDGNYDFDCKSCPYGTYSAEGSVGIEMCHPKRHCDKGDLDMEYSECGEDGMRTVTYEWADADGDGEIDCDPNHMKSEIPTLPSPQNVQCKTC